jgi:hypothetical protein
MRSSFVAVIGRLGLESLVPECHAAHRWLRSAVADRPAACLWAVMEPAEAAGIRDLLEADEADWALTEFARAAEFKGPLHVCGLVSDRGAAL